MLASFIMPDDSSQSQETIMDDQTAQNKRRRVEENEGKQRPLYARTSLLMSAVERGGEEEEVKFFNDWDSL
jgi:hypothetical protein